MKNVQLLMAFLASVTLLIGCGQQAEIQPPETRKVTATEFIDYYTVKAQEGEKLSREEAEQKFQTLDCNSNGELTKEEATGEKLIEYNR